MLNCLQISNYALIEKEEVEFGPGFNVITGESGAGKSILMGALKLLCGGRIDHGIIRNGAKNCIVSGIFTTPQSQRKEISDCLENAGVPFDCGNGDLVLRRVIGTASTRNFINDTPVGSRLIGEIGAKLIDHYQAGEQLMLNSPSKQLELLDRYAGLMDECALCGELCRKIDELEAELKEFNANLPDESESDRLRLIIEEIAEINPVPDEDEILTGKFKLGSNARQVLETIGNVINLLTESENSISDKVGEVYRQLGEIARLDSNMAGELITDCENLQNEVAVLSGRIAALGDQVELDPEALDAIETRMGELFTLKRRYGPTLEQVFITAATAQKRLDEYNATINIRKEFAVKKQNLKEKLLTVARHLSEKRQQYAGEFLKKVGERLNAIGFINSKLSANFTQVPPGITGTDKLELMFTANAGEEPKPLRKIASSGELSRLMLALKTVLADADAIPTVIFDEIDMNIGGETANRVGEELHNLGKHRQILCISHLAQVAVRANCHFVVVKKSYGGRTVSNAVKLESPADELARMLGGGEHALRHASQLYEKVNQRNRHK